MKQVWRLRSGITLLSLIALVAVAYSCWRLRPRPTHHVRCPVGDLYGLAFASMYSLEERPGGRLPGYVVVQSSTKPGTVIDSIFGREYFEWSQLTGCLPRLRRSTYACFEAENEHARAIEGFETHPGLQWMEPVHADAYNDWERSPEEKWRDFERRYPGARGCVRMSAPGFSEDHAQALVYVESYESIDSGCGLYVLLECQRGAWQVVGVWTAWIV